MIPSKSEKKKCTTSIIIMVPHGSLRPPSELAGRAPREKEKEIKTPTAFYRRDEAEAENFSHWVRKLVLGN